MTAAQLAHQDQLDALWDEYLLGLDFPQDLDPELAETFVGLVVLTVLGLAALALVGAAVAWALS